MIDKTELEKLALKRTRKAFGETLQELGLMEPFFHRSAADIDRLIEACITGYNQAFKDIMEEDKKKLQEEIGDEIPF